MARKRLLRPILLALTGIGMLRCGLVKQFKAVAVDGWLDVEFTPAADAARPAAVLSGLEVQAEGW